MRLTHFGILSSTLFVLSGCLSNTPTRTLSGGANDPVAAAQRAALGLGDMATKNAGSLPDLTATSLTLGTALPLTSGGTGATNASGARTALGATTVGSNLFTLSNPSAESFLKVSSTNTVTARSASDFRTDLGATTVGANLFTLSNPGAERFLKVNTDNTVTARSASDFRNDIGVLGTMVSPAFTGYLSTTCVSVQVDDDNTVTTPNNILGDVPAEQHSCILLDADTNDTDNSATITLNSTGAASGSRLTLIVTAGAVIINDAASPNLSAADWTGNQGDTLQLIFDGTNWIELSRSDN